MLSTLEAVNQMLAAIGETRVNSIGTDVPDAEEALEILEQVRIEILSRGWHANTSVIEMKADANTNEIVVPNNYLRVHTSGRSSQIMVSIRQEAGIRKLYNVTRETLKWDHPVSVEVIKGPIFDDLPYTLAHYITCRATRIFQENSLSSVSLDNFASRNEQEAWAQLLDYEAEAGNYNSLTGTASMQQMTRRNSPYGW